LQEIQPDAKEQSRKTDATANHAKTRRPNTVVLAWAAGHTAKITVAWWLGAKASEVCKGLCHQPMQSRKSR
jgi:endonuclease I